MENLLKNSFYSTVTLGSRFLSNAVLFIIIARVMGAEEFGRFAFAVSFSGIFLVLVDYGFCLQVVRDVSIMPENALSLLSGMLNGKLLLSMVSTLAVFMIINLLGYPIETRQIVCILWFAFLFYSFGLFFNSIFRGLNKFQYETYPTIVLNGIQFVLVLICLLFGCKTITISIVYLISRIVYLLFSVYLIQTKLGSISFRFDMVQGFSSLRKSFPFGVHMILATLYFQLDTVFLSFYKSNSEVGFYQAAMRILLATMIICDVIANSYFPLIAKSFGNDKNTFEKTGGSFNKYLILTGGAIAVGFLLYADYVIKMFYGKDYSESVVILQLLSVVIFLRFAGGAYAAIITVSDNQTLRAVGVGISLVVNVALNFIMIPKYGAEGAAIVSIITHLVLVAIYAVLSYKLNGVYLISKHCAAGIFVLLFGLFVCYLSKSISLIASVSLFIFFLFTLSTVSFERAERQGIKKIVNRIIMHFAWVK